MKPTSENAKNLGELWRFTVEAADESACTAEYEGRVSAVNGWGVRIHGRHCPSPWEVAHGMPEGFEPAERTIFLPFRSVRFAELEGEA